MDVSKQIQAEQTSRGTGFGVLSAEDDTFASQPLAGLESSIAASAEAEDSGSPTKPAALTAQQLLDDVPQQQDHEAPSQRIADRESAYHARRQRVLSPDRSDAFAAGGQPPSAGSLRSYKDVMAEASVAREREEIKHSLAEAPAAAKKRRRW